MYYALNIEGRVESPSSECMQKQRQCENKEYCFLCCKCQDNTVFSGDSLLRLGHGWDEAYSS